MGVDMEIPLDRGTLEEEEEEKEEEEEEKEEGLLVSPLLFLL